MSCLDEAGKFCRHCGRDWTRRNDIRTPPLPGEHRRGRLCFLRHHSGGRRRSEHICNSQTLERAADLQWNICTAADELVMDRQGDLVFFLMCPQSVEG